MDWKIRRVKFASKKQEDDYKRLAVSKNPEDKKQYSVLRQIRKKVWNKYNTGKKIPKDNIPAIYRQMFHIDNLWKLNLSKHEVVFYSIVSDDILIVDIL